MSASWMIFSFEYGSEPPSQCLAVAFGPWKHPLPLCQVTGCGKSVCALGSMQPSFDRMGTDTAGIYRGPVAWSIWNSAWSTLSRILEVCTRHWFQSEGALPPKLSFYWREEFCQCTRNLTSNWWLGLAASRSLPSSSAHWQSSQWVSVGWCLLHWGMTSWSCLPPRLFCATITYHSGKVTGFLAGWFCSASVGWLTVLDCGLCLLGQEHLRMNWQRRHLHTGYCPQMPFWVPSPLLTCDICGS